MYMQDFYYQHISYILDNYEDNYWQVQDLVKQYKTGKILSLSDALSDLYYDAIGKVLLWAPKETALGKNLIEELCYGIPASVFSDLADKYAPYEETVDA